MSIPQSSKSLLRNGSVVVISKHFCGPCDRAKSMLKQVYNLFR